jgi:hypothetical protein
MPAAIAVPAIIGAAGIGASIYGANKSTQAAEDAAAANSRSVAETNAMNYKRWLESQGVGANGESVNTWLPRNFMLSSTALKPRRFVKASATAAPSAPAAPVNDPSSPPISDFGGPPLA